MSKVAVLIPCYNEELTVEKVVKGFKKELLPRISMSMTITLKIKLQLWH